MRDAAFCADCCAVGKMIMDVCANDAYYVKINDRILR